MKFHIRTLGCKMNWLDSARIGAALQGAGHEAVNDEAEADYIFVNTCTVTAEADRKSRQTVNNIGNRQKQVAVLGCGPRVDEGKWQENGDSLVFTDDAAVLSYFGIEQASTPYPLNSRTRLPIAIQTGCDNHCTFCITRVARGAHRNIPAAEIVGQINQAREAGVNEIVLTGINLAAWGCEDSNRPEQARLGELLAKILCNTEMPRIRLSSLGPEYLNRGFFDAYSDPRLCDYLHISMQSGSPTVLKRMRRGHGTEELYTIAEQARRFRPDTALAADMIAGFPGESEAEHAETLAFVRDIGFAKLHVFPYSIREGTPAASLPQQTDGTTRKRRAGDLRQLARELRESFIHEQMGKDFLVLVEKGGTGLTSNYIRVKVPELFRGQIRTVTLNANTLAEP